MDEGMVVTTPLMRLKAAVVTFENVQKRFRSLGAEDTEPSWQWHACLVRSATGQDPKVPDTPDGWELYGSGRPSVEAAKVMNRAAKIACEVILSTPVGRSREVIDYLEDYCWRCPSLWQGSGGSRNKSKG